MTKCVAHLFSLEEAEEMLQKCLDDNTLKLRACSFFYDASSDDIYLDGSEIDERMAQILNVKKCYHYRTESGMVVVEEQEDI